MGNVEEGLGKGELVGVENTAAIRTIMHAMDVNQVFIVVI